MNEPMNENTQRLKQMLEAATAADTGATRNGTEAVPCSDAENASLREAWLAFGQLIRAADAAMPDVHIAEPGLAAPITRQKPRGSRLPGLVVAAAAAVLLAVTCGWWLGRGGQQQNRNGSNLEPSLAQTPEHAKPQAVKQEPPAPNVAQAPNSTEKKATSGVAKTSTWDDPLETQIASVSEEIGEVEQNWRHRVDDADVVQYRIDEVSASLENDKL